MDRGLAAVFAQAISSIQHQLSTFCPHLVCWWDVGCFIRKLVILTCSVCISVLQHCLVPPASFCGVGLHALPGGVFLGHLGSRAHNPTSRSEQQVRVRDASVHQPQLREQRRGRCGQTGYLRAHRAQIRVHAPQLQASQRHPPARRHSHMVDASHGVHHASPVHLASLCALALRVQLSDLVVHHAPGGGARRHLGARQGLEQALHPHLRPGVLLGERRRLLPLGRRRQLVVDVGGGHGAPADG
mmetsp:Transcript_28597/g.54660  ORF Transcript_28597/g.54660 Transcript_28597/m.54660 type:complete len:243 (+) Transcript_28597:475-1203(+)